MRLNEIEFTDAVPVDGYGPGFWRVGLTAIKARRISPSAPPGLVAIAPTISVPSRATKISPAATAAGNQSYWSGATSRPKA